ncbi:LysR family transcriptional regulator [Ottowia sp. GY511]|uniref:LysR family transcriptional regulator n=1 Tax=Ottowia flava TaxID=2675430 RepID=A0ABW4KP17_9BURK|nr:LysR family transcriptional regulator [Ottowia sp. GY511]TXK26795.1 LysR family transcriptional regulator [Ottowia sp. GY511]
MRLDLIDLRLFLHVHEQGSITAGAARSHMTLASASARIRALEDALGTPLLLRDRRGVQATPAGQTLAREAQAVLAQMDQLQAALAQHIRGPKAHLRLLANTSAATVHLPPLLARFLAAHPGYTLALDERRSADIADALRRGRADLAVLSDAADLQGLDVTPLRADPLVLVVPRGHALAGRRRLALADALGEPFIGLPDTNALQALVTEQARRLQDGWDGRVRLGSLEAVCRMVALGAGVAVVPRAMAEREAASGRLRRVPLSDAWAQRQLVLAGRDLAALPAATARLARFLIDATDGGASGA